jgi:outer membrane receptor for ferrienterochelin and colicins
MGGAQYVYNINRLLFMPSALTAGVEYNRDELKDNMWGYNRYTRQIVNIGSAFLQNEWKDEKWGILVGARLDKHNMINRVIVSPRANLRYNPTAYINLRLSYSSGFRAPQAFDEDLHIEAVGGTVSMIERDPDLKEERSHSFSASADMYHRFGDLQANFLVEGFYTRLSDVFVMNKIGENEDGVIIRERTNGSGAKVMGLTLDGKLACLSLWQLQAGLTLQRSRYDKPEQWSETAPAEKKIFRTPDVYGYFTATYSPVKPLSIALSGTYTGTMPVQHLAGYIPKDVAVRTPAFFDMGLKVAYDMKLYKSVTLQLHAGMQNLFDAYQDDFDRGKDRDSGYIYGPSLPRSWYAGLKIGY